MRKRCRCLVITLGLYAGTFSRSCWVAGPHSIIDARVRDFQTWAFLDAVLAEQCADRTRDSVVCCKLPLWENIYRCRTVRSISSLAQPANEPHLGDFCRTTPAWLGCGVREQVPRYAPVANRTFLNAAEHWRASPRCRNAERADRVAVNTLASDR